MKDFIPYQESLELKQLGFDEDCFGYYDTEGLQIKYDVSNPTNKNSLFTEHSITNNPKISAPTFSQAFRWFRGKYNLPSTIMYRVSIDDGSVIYDWLIIGQDVVYRHFDTYEDAELACIKKLIEIVKKK